MSNNVNLNPETEKKVNLSDLDNKTSLSRIFRLSPLIRITLLSLYVALTLPLPFLAGVTSAPVSPTLLWGGMAIGFVALYGALSERVIVDEEKIEVCYPRWFPPFFRKGWSLSWTEIKDLKLRTTGQGGLVYYFITQSADRAYLLPMRVAGFARLVKFVEEKTGIDTKDVRPLSQPWMYLILLVFTLFLLLIDGWTILTALTTS
ncbi:conserved hypothetical protein [Gloeothece citriformis PCC 7424]|uniref:Uncharacterized protein n=1 Tax=Gloeothece citriformis (strain PCC 7424) TaxID=65393 RepID=B7KF89_GLOC7|nr:hypothetical protein [Gloeothece citriformis]ACK71805.1 conserved hypothetical protein [Gloeothece citriformis PCC 7424]